MFYDNALEKFMVKWPQFLANGIALTTNRFRIGHKSDSKCIKQPKIDRTE